MHFLLVALFASTCFAANAVNSLREDTHIVNQGLLMGNGANLITLSENGGSLFVDSRVILDDQIEIRGGNPAAGRVLTSDANGLASWVDASASEWTDTGNILHPNEATVDEVAVGGTSEAAADIFLGVDGAAVFNEQANSVDFRIESSAEQNAFLLEGSSGNIGIGIASPSRKLEVNGNALFAGNIVPTVDNGFDLGSDSLRWRDLFLGPNSLRIGTSGNEAIISYDTALDRLNFDIDGDNTAEITMTNGGDLSASSVTAPTVTATTSFDAASFRSTNDGAANSPAYSFASDTDNGMRRGGFNDLRLSASGVDQLRVQSGTVTALNNFDVDGTSTFGNANQATISDTGNFRAADGTLNSPGLSFNNDTDSGFSLAADNDIRFSVGGTQEVRFLPSGVTITDALTVSGTTTLNGNFEPNGVIRVGTDGSTSNPAYSFSADTDTGIRRAVTNNMRLVAGGADQLTIQSGTVRVLNNLDVDGSSTFGNADQAAITGDGFFRATNGLVSVPGISFNSDSDTGFFLAADNDLRLAVAGTQEMRIVGTGVTITDDLTVGDVLTVNGTFTPDNILRIGVDGSTSNPAYSFNADSDSGIRRAGSNDLRFVAAGLDIIQIISSTARIFRNLDVDGSSTFGNADQATISDTGHFRAADGLANSPGLSFNSDIDCGFFRNAEDDIRFSVGGVQTARFTTSSVTINLDLNVQDTMTAEDIVPAANDTHDLGSNSLRWLELFLGAGDLHLGTSSSDEALIGYNTANNSLQIDLASGSNGSIVVNDNSLDVDFRVEGNNDTNLIRAEAFTDNVGIGFSAPAAKLAVNGNGVFAGNILPSMDNGFSLGSDTFRWDKLFLDPGSLSIGVSGDDVLLSYNTDDDVLEVSKGIEATTIAAINAVIKPSGSFAGAVVLCQGGVSDLTTTTFTCNDPRLSDVSSFTDEFFSTSADNRKVICWTLGAVTDNNAASITIVNNNDDQITITGSTWNLGSGTGTDKIASITCSI